MQTRKPAYRRFSRGLLLKPTYRTRRQKANLRTPFKSLLKSHRKTQTSRVARHRLQDNRYIKGLKPFQEARRTIRLPFVSTWRRLAVLKAGQRCKHRWKRKD